MGFGVLAAVTFCLFTFCLVSFTVLMIVAHYSGTQVNNYEDS